MATTINELRVKRAQAWEAAKAFLESHRTEKGILSAEDDATYTKMMKIRKEGTSGNDEISFRGVIDSSCVFTPDQDKQNWSNGKDHYKVADFEQYLRHKQ